MAVWTHCFLLVLSVAGLEGRRVRDLQDGQGFVRVTSIIMPPFLQLRQTNSSEELQGNQRYEGFLADLLEEIGDRASINYNIYLVKDGKFGYRDSNGQWHGMIGELVRREAEIAVAPLTRTKLREEVVDFSYTFMTAPLTMLVPTDSPYQTIDDLVNSSYPEIQYGVIATGSTAEAFRSSTQPPYSLAWANMASHGDMMVDSLQKGVDRVKEGNYVLIGEAPELEYHANQHPCELRVTENFQLGDRPRSYSLAMPKGHPYMKDITQALLELQEEGVLRELYEKWWQAQECQSSGASSYHLHTAVILLVLTILYALH